MTKKENLESSSRWSSEYWSDVERWLLKLTKEQFKSVSKEIKLLEVYGNNLKLPHSKSLGKGLFELRERNYGFRIYYCFYKDKIIILLNAGDKGTQKNDIKIARERQVLIKK